MTSILKADTIQDTDGNNIINENSNTITIGASGDTTNIVGTLQNNGAAVGGTNTPAFRVYRSSSAQTISSGSNVKIQFNSETYDTDNAFDSSTNYRFTPQTSGKYFIHFHYGHNSGTAHTIVAVKLFKNGSSLAEKTNNHAGGTKMYEVSSTVSLNGSSDYIEAYVYHNYGSDRSSDYGSENVYLEGFKLIE